MYSPGVHEHVRSSAMPSSKPSALGYTALHVTRQVRSGQRTRQVTRPATAAAGRRRRRNAEWLQKVYGESLSSNHLCHVMC